MINDLTWTVLAIGLLLYVGWIIYATCAPLRPPASPSCSEEGRALPDAPTVNPARRFLAGTGWGLFAGLVVLSAVHILMVLRR